MASSSRQSSGGRRLRVTAAQGCILGLWVLITFAIPVNAAATDVWLAGLTPMGRQATEPGAPSDYMDLFKPGAPWARAAGGVTVFKTSTQWILRSPADDLARMIRDLKRRRIALAMEALIISHDGSCGQRVEGYSSPGDIAAAAKRIRAFGGELAYVAMDEPLWFGFRYRGPNACRSSLPDLARNVAANVAAIRAQFPNVKVGDIEPITPGAGPDWAETILQWESEFHAATGAHLSFFHADTAWTDPTVRSLPGLAGELHRRGVRFGLIYDGDPRDPSDQAWVGHAEDRIRLMEDRVGLTPDDAVIQSWMRHPERLLPEDDPATLTGLALHYVRRHS